MPRPVFVVGFARSGTTLLQSLLGAHSRIAAPPEVHFFLRIYNLRDYWGDLRDDDRAAAAMHELVNPPADLFADCGFDEAALLQRFLASDRSYRSLLACLLDDFAERRGKARWSEKTPEQTPAQIWHLMPDAQIVHIYRDPRAVIASTLTTWADPRPAWGIAQQWASYTRTVQGEAREHADALLAVRYEDLASQPEQTLRSVCTFLEEDFEPAMLASSSERATAIPATTGRWQAQASTSVHAPESRWNSLSLPRRALAARVLDGELEPLGYPPVDRSLVTLGRLLGPTRIPRLWAERRRQRRLVAGLTTPEAKYAAVHAFIDSELSVRLRRTE